MPVGGHYGWICEDVQAGGPEEQGGEAEAQVVPAEGEELENAARVLGQVVPAPADEEGDDAGDHERGMVAGDEADPRQLQVNRPPDHLDARPGQLPGDVLGEVKGGQAVVGKVQGEEEDEHASQQNVQEEAQGTRQG